MTLFLFLLSTSFAGASNFQALLEQFTQVENRIAKSSQAKCEPQLSKKHCSLEQVCQLFENKEDRMYIYQNSVGEKLVNLQLNQYRESAVRCLGDVKGDLNMGALYSASTKNLTFDPLSTDYQKQVDQQEKRVEKIFEETKKQAISYLMSKAQKNPKSAKQVKNLIDRVEAVELNLLRFRQNGFSGDCDLPNAYYLKEQGMIQICPQMLDLPSGALMGIFAHELGHAVDPCNIQLNYFKYESGRFEITAEDQIDNLSESQERKLDLAIPSLQLKEYPFRSVMQCLQQKQSAAIGPPTQKKQLAHVEKLLADPELEVEDREYLTYKKQSLERGFKENPFCSSFSDSTHGVEVFSDWFSAEVMAHIVSKTLSQSRRTDLALESQLFILASSCENLKQGAKELFLSGSLKEQLLSCSSFNPPVLSEEEEGIVQPHPTAQVRFERVLLAQPVLRQALNCPVSQQPKHCQ